MRRHASIVCAIALACAMLCAFVLAACSGGSDEDQKIIAGKWVCVAIDDGNGPIEIADYDDVIGMTGEQLATLSFNSDGSVYFTVKGEDMLASYGEGAVTWEESAAGVMIHADGEVAFELTYDNTSKRLTMEYDGQAIYFERA